MTSNHFTNESDSADEEVIPLTIRIEPEHVERVERIAARTGRTADQLLRDFVSARLGPLGVRIVP